MEPSSYFKVSKKKPEANCTKSTYMYVVRYLLLLLGWHFMYDLTLQTFFGSHLENVWQWNNTQEDGGCHLYCTCILLNFGFFHFRPKNSFRKYYFWHSSLQTFSTHLSRKWERMKSRMEENMKGIGGEHEVSLVWSMEIMQEEDNEERRNKKEWSKNEEKWETVHCNPFQQQVFLICKEHQSYTVHANNDKFLKVEIRKNGKKVMWV